MLGEHQCKCNSLISIEKHRGEGGLAEVCCKWETHKSPQRNTPYAVWHLQVAIFAANTVSSIPISLSVSIVILCTSPPPISHHCRPAMQEVQRWRLLCDILQRGTLTYFPTNPGNNPDAQLERARRKKEERGERKDMTGRQREREEGKEE